MQNGLFKLDWGSIVDAIITSVAAAVVVALVALVTTTHFDVWTADWIAIGKSMVNLAVTAGVVSLGKDFFSTSAGSVLGVGPANPVQ